MILHSASDAEGEVTVNVVVELGLMVLMLERDHHGRWFQVHQEEADATCGFRALVSCLHLPRPGD